MSVRVLVGDALAALRTLPAESFHCCVTSPPYWGLRDYGVPGQLGLEKTPQEHVERMVEVFREVRRALRPDGTAWVNYGDSYAANRTYQVPDSKHVDVGNNGGMKVPPGLKPKDLVGMPWRVAFALQADGWYLRSDIIWHKPNPMPESVTDRPTKSHEYIFLLSKAARYYYDAEAAREADVGGHASGNGFAGRQGDSERVGPQSGGVGTHEEWVPGGGRNLRTVWTIATHPFPGAHFATFPPDLAKRCILAGCPEGGSVLDPFGGAGTTGLVADRLGRNATLIELNPAYAKMAEKRIRDDAPMLVDVTRK